MKKDLLLLILLILPSFALLFQKGYFSMHDDLQSMRQYKMDQCFQDNQLPCRWVTDMGYGYGYPLFNYYPPLPYLIGQVFRTTGMSYIDVVKAVGILGWLTSAVFMYFLAREFFGRTGGLVSSVLYTYAPYHSVDFYVRGAMNEFWAMAFYPAIFWASYRLIRDTTWPWIVLLGLFVAGLMLSHNPMLMIFTPVFLAWIIFWWFKVKSISSFPKLAVAALIAFGLAAFFTLPVLVESRYAHVETLIIGYFNYLAHYLDIKQIFFWINWGYGSSILGPDDTMSFALGYLQWLIPGLVVLAAVLVKKYRHLMPLLLFLLVCLLGSLFMTHSKSTFIWKIITPLEFLQFPWRFLTLSVFIASLMAGGFAVIFNRKLLLAAVLGLALLLNANYFRPQYWYPDMTDAKKFSGKSWQLLITSGIFDYLPKGAPQPPADPKSENMHITSGQGMYSTKAFRSDYQQYLVTITTSNAIAEIQTYYFPGWHVYLDGKEVTIDPSRDSLLGRMKVDISFGDHELVARFQDTPVRAVGKALSVITVLALFGFVLTQLVPWTPKSL